MSRTSIFPDQLATLAELTSAVRRTHAKTWSLPSLSFPAFRLALLPNAPTALLSLPAAPPDHWVEGFAASNRPKLPRDKTCERAVAVTQGRRTHCHQAARRPVRFRTTCGAAVPVVRPSHAHVQCRPSHHAAAQRLGGARFDRTAALIRLDGRELRSKQRNRPGPGTSAAGNSR